MFYRVIQGNMILPSEKFRGTKEIGHKLKADCTFQNLFFLPTCKPKQKINRV
jgi:hypothetical protein